MSKTVDHFVSIMELACEGNIRRTVDSMDSLDDAHLAVFTGRCHDLARLGTEMLQLRQAIIQKRNESDQSEE